MKLQAIKQWLQKRGLDPTGDRETCAKRLQEAMKIDQVGLPASSLEPIEPMEQEPTVANGNVENVWSRMGGKTRDLRTRRSKLPIEQRLGPKVMTERVDSDEEIEDRKWERRRVKNVPHVPLVEYSQEFCIEDMEQRAERLSDMDTLRKRKRRFDEELASEFTSVTSAKLKNLRLKRFKKDEQ